MADARPEKAYAWGRSQAGRDLRDFVYLGFNAGADGSHVFDGLLPHVSGCGLMWMNHRFANVIRQAGPGVMVPRGPSALPRLSWGSGFANGILAEPPRQIGEEHYVVGVPATDADGNDLAGVRAPMVAAPLATYTGWNIRAHGFGYGAMHESTGSTLPFPTSEAERRQTGDPRASIEARYGSADRYRDAIRRAGRGACAGAPDDRRGRRALRGRRAALVRAAAPGGGPRERRDRDIRRRRRDAARQGETAAAQMPL